MKNYFRCLCIAASVILTCGGCAFMEAAPVAPSVDTSSSYFARGFNNPELTALINKTLPQAQQGIWDIDSLTLAALYYNPGLISAADKLKLAQAGEITAGERLNPTLGFGQGRDNTLMHPPLFDLNVNMPIEITDKRKIRIEQAQHLSKAAAYQFGASAWQVRSLVLHALIDIDAARTSARFYKKQADSLKALLDVFDARIAQGQIPSVTASQTHISYQQAVLSEKEADRLLAEAKTHLAAAIGIPAKALANIRIDTDFLVRRKQPISISMEAALKENNTLLAALAEYKAAHSALQMELAKQIPDINIGPAYEWTGDGSKFTLGLSLTLPVFNNNEGAIAEGVSRRKLAADAFNALQADIIGKIETAQASLAAAHNKLATADNLLAAQRAKLDLLETQLKPGEASHLPLLLAQSEIYTSEIARHDAWVQVLNAKAALEDASQQLQFGTVSGGTISTNSLRGEDK